MMDIRTNFLNGSIEIEGNLIPNKESLFPKTEGEKFLNLSRHKIKKSTIYRIETMEHYKKCFIESISIEYNCSEIKKITINFIEKNKKQPCSAKSTKTAITLEKITKTKPLEIGMSEIKFIFQWGTINLSYDIKTSSSTAVLHYKNP
ncbi:hypothetical protein O3301_16400 [Janthinobacterium sp. SUN211]|uniref:hypothetical protein n=1 Tax=Janthinobacterium sp. SUN211 TaxID=3014786 RepID=UPI002713FC2F|nr:hypothetical protein [Janthinobacterium sp. SUN211]MDO8050052.1 hypothetical protein [Janthinobacterium sp. SUN211]